MQPTAGPLTVKHIEKNGRQSIRQALVVEFIPQEPGGKISAVLAHGVANEPEPITYGDGRIFVMNEAGATVSRYDLDGETAAV